MDRSKVEVIDGRCEVHGEHRGYRVRVSSRYDEIEDHWTAHVYLRKGRNPAAMPPAGRCVPLSAGTLEEAIRSGFEMAEKTVDERLGA